MVVKATGRSRSFSDPMQDKISSSQLQKKVQCTASELLVATSLPKDFNVERKNIFAKNVFFAGAAATFYSTCMDGSFSGSVIVGVVCFFLVFFYFLMEKIFRSILSSKNLFSLCCQNEPNVGKSSRKFQGQNRTYLLEKAAILDSFCKEHEGKIPSSKAELENLQKVLQSWGYCSLFDLMTNKFELLITGVSLGACRSYLKRFGNIEPVDFLTQFVDRLSNRNDPHVLHDAEKSRFFIVLGSKGHAMTYEFGRKLDNSYYFSIYNRGQELDYEPWSDQMVDFWNDDEKDITVYTIEGLTKNVLRRPEFLQGLITHFRSSETKEVYDHFQKYLIDEGKGKLKEPTLEDVHRIQKYGTCLYSNTSTPLRTVVTDPVLWKRLKLYEIQTYLQGIGKETLKQEEPELYFYVSKQIQKTCDQIAVKIALCGKSHACYTSG